jgi:hypothetical protein
VPASGLRRPAPHFNHNFGDVNNGNTSKDVSQILTNTLALNTSGPLAGRVNTPASASASPATPLAAWSHEIRWPKAFLTFLGGSHRRA